MNTTNKLSQQKLLPICLLFLYFFFGISGSLLSQTNISCGQTLNIDNTNGTDVLSNYPNPPWPFGPVVGNEVILPLNLSGCEREVCVTTANRTTNLNAFILTDPTDASSTILWINGAGETKCFIPQAGQTYYLVVDGFQDQHIGTMDVSIDCSEVIRAITTRNSACCYDGSNSNFTSDVTVTFDNPPSTGTLDLTGDGTATVNVSSLTGTTHTFTDVPMTANGGPINLTANFSALTGCDFTNASAGTAPAACPCGAPPVSGSGQVCKIEQLTEGSGAQITTALAFGQQFLACDDGVITQITVSFFETINSLATFTLQLSSGGNTLAPQHTQNVSITAGGAVTIPLTKPFTVQDNQQYSFSILGTTGTGNAVFIELIGSNPYGDGLAFVEVSGNSSPSAPDRDLVFSVCIAPCNIASICTSNLSACSFSCSNSTYTADVTVTFDNPPCTGTLDLTGDGTATVNASSLTGNTHTFTNVQMPADGGPINLTAAFGDLPSCTKVATAGTAPAACPRPCSITAISTSNLSACSYDGNNSTFTTDVTVTFADPPCTGTLDLTGDGTATVNASTLTGTTHTFSNVSMTADGTPINLIATFSALVGCTFTTASAGTAPVRCPFGFTADNTGGSTGGNPFMVSDPCSCNGDQVLNADGSVATTGTFEETVTVTGPTGLQVRAADATGLLNTSLPAPLTEIAPGSYQITFNHTDRMGYSITRFEYSIDNGLTFHTATPLNGVTPITVSNVCAYPRVVCSPAIPSSVIPSDPPITLGLSETSTDVSFMTLTGYPQFTINGNPATVFNPADPSLAAGNYTILGIYDITAGSGQNGTATNPAIPIDKDGNASNGVCPVNVFAKNLDLRPIPTMSEWGLLIFGLLIMNISVFFLRRREELLAEV